MRTGELLTFGTELLVLGALAVSRSWAPAVLGQGAEEFRRLGRSLFTATVVPALGGIARTSRNIKLWIFVAIPAIALVTTVILWKTPRAVLQGQGAF